MKLIEWVRFSWDFEDLPALDLELPPHYRIEAATLEDEEPLRQVISRCFRLDPVWSPALHETLQTIESWLGRALQSDRHMCLVLRHGARIIGASVLSLDPESDSHLSPGPCISMEYRNRGFGSRLLEHSFHVLSEAHVTRAFALTRSNTSVARFLYPKFHGVSAPIDRTPLLAA
jgi:ribosomal protein S18 acetylase RimI-like enzyme